MSLFLNRGYLITKMEGAGRKTVLLFCYQNFIILMIVWNFKKSCEFYDPVNPNPNSDINLL